MKIHLFLDVLKVGILAGLPTDYKRSCGLVCNSFTQIQTQTVHSSTKEVLIDFIQFSR